MADIIYEDVSYCATCDRYFPGIEARAAHVHWSPLHPECAPCQRRFANKNALRNHYVLSRRHHYCRVCEKHFRSEAGFKVHIDYVHRGDTDEEDTHPLDATIADSDEDWEDDFGEAHFPELVGPPVTGAPGSDEEVSIEDEYWDEDDERAPVEDDDVYAGFAPTPAEARRDVAALTAYVNAPPAPAHDHEHEHESEEEEYDEGNDADGESDDEDGAPRRAPRKAGKKGKKGPAPAPAQFTCPLCLEPEAMADCSSTRCGHLFCTPCIKTALHARKQCPVCREPAVHKQLRKIFLPSTV